MSQSVALLHQYILFDRVEEITCVFRLYVVLNFGRMATTKFGYSFYGINDVKRGTNQYLKGIGIRSEMKIKKTRGSARPEMDGCVKKLRQVLIPNSPRRFQSIYGRDCIHSLVGYIDIATELIGLRY